MRISPIQNNVYTRSVPLKNKVQNVQTNPSKTFELPSLHAPSFCGLMRKDKGIPIDSSFFRDYETLQSACDILKENFPEGAEILDYACSDGEEAISLYTLLGDERDKFKITGIDIGSDPINLAHEGVYSLFGGAMDEFLMPGAKRNAKEQELSDMFYEIMEPTHEPDEPLNNSAEFVQTFLSAKPKFRKQLFFRLKDEVKDNLTFRLGDINEIDKEATEGKVGAVFFRNAFYHLMDSSDGEDLLTGNAVFLDVDEDENDGSTKYTVRLFKPEKTLEERQAIADKLVDKVYDKLEVGGVFVLGNSLNESIFIADDTVPEKDTIRFGDTNVYKKTMRSLDKKMNSFILKADVRLIPAMRQAKETLDDTNEDWKNQADVRVLKKTPMQTALERDGRFVPVHKSSMKGLEEFETPTVWVKVK